MQFTALFIDSLTVVLKSVGIVETHQDASPLVETFLDASSKQSAKRTEFIVGLKLREEEFDLLRAELQLYLEHKTGGSRLPSRQAKRNADLAILRSLSWFETAKSRSSTVPLPSADMALQDHHAAFKLLRTLELMMRALVQEQYEDSEALIERLRQVFPADFKKAAGRSQFSPLEGLILKDLIRIFVDRIEWSRIGLLYETTEFLTLLRAKRETAEKFLEDVRRIRNAVMHLHSLSAVQLSLLNYYYEELVEPVKSSFRSHQTKVDPTNFEAPTEAALHDYEKSVLDEMSRESRTTRRWAVLSLAASALIALAALPILLPTLRISIDPALAFSDEWNRNPGDHGSLAVQACEQGKITALNRLGNFSDAGKAMSGADADQLNDRVMFLAATDPKRLTPCVTTLHKIGWSPNQIGSPVRNHFGSEGSTARPAGYISYLEARKTELAPGVSVNPTELRCTALLYAIWHGDTALVRELVAAGAKATAPCVVDGIWLNKTEDVPVFSPFAEAKRIGNFAILDLLK